MKNKYIIPSLLLAFFLLHGSPLSAGDSLFEKNYFHHKSSGNYREGVNILTEWTLKTRDPATAEINLFRVSELCRYPELYGLAAASLKKIRSSQLVNEHPFLLARTDQLIARALLKTGDAAGAENQIKQLYFSDFFLIGPFPHAGIRDFNSEGPIEKTAIHEKRYRGTHHTVTWFRVKPDPDGSIHFSDLYPNPVQGIYYLKRNFHLPEGGIHTLIMGKSGFTDVWLDGKNVFSNRAEHHFHNDQYMITLLIPAGDHTILIKTGCLKADPAISFRLADKNGNPVQLNPGGFNPSLNTWKKQNSLIGHTVAFSGSLEELVTKKNHTDRSLFLSAYLSYMTGSGMNRNGFSLSLFSGIDEQSKYFEPARYYAGIIASSPEDKDRFFTDAFEAGKKNIEAMTELILLKIRHGFLHESEKLSAALEEINSIHPMNDYLKAVIYSKRNWSFESHALSTGLKKSRYPSLGYLVSYRFHMAMNNYSEAANDLEQLVRLDPDNFTCREHLVQVFVSTGRFREALNVLQESLQLHPGRVSIKLRMAEIAEQLDGIQASLPYLASALHASPENPEVLEATGRAYIRINKRETGLYYLMQSLYKNPGNSILKEYLEVIRNRKSP